MGERADQVNEQHDPQAIQADIEQTRAEMSQTIDAIQERLSPAYIKEQMKQQVRESIHETKEATIDTVKGAGTTMIERIKQNPIPAAIAGLSLAWFFKKSSQSTHSSYQPQQGFQGYQNYNRGPFGQPQPYYQSSYPGYQGYQTNQPYQGYQGNQPYQGGYEQQEGVLEKAQEKVQEVAGQAKETVSELGSQVKQTVSNIGDKASELGSQAKETVSDFGWQARQTAEHVGDQAQQQFYHAKSSLQQTLYDNPMALGAVALAVGTAVGLVVPETQVENRMLGPTRDHLVETVQERAKETMEKVQNVASTAVEQVQETVKQEARNEGLTSM